MAIMNIGNLGQKKLEELRLDVMGLLGEHYEGTIVEGNL